MTGLPGRSVTTRAAALLSGTAMLAALAALPARPAWASPAQMPGVAAGAVAKAPARYGVVGSDVAAGHARRAAPTRGRGAADGAAGNPGPATARPGANLLLNPGGQTGTVSARGWDSVTIPGWQVVSGLPTAVRSSTPRFPPATGRWPLVPGGQLFAGGAGAPRG